MTEKTIAEHDADMKSAGLAYCTQVEKIVKELQATKMVTSVPRVGRLQDAMKEVRAISRKVANLEKMLVEVHHHYVVIIEEEAVAAQKEEQRKLDARDKIKAENEIVEIGGIKGALLPFNDEARIFTNGYMWWLNYGDDKPGSGPFSSGEEAEKWYEGGGR